MKIKALSIVASLIIAGTVAAVTLKLPPRTNTEASYGQAAIGGAFSLTDGDGKTVTDQQFHGKWMLVYFGFTHCPDICPMGLVAITQALEILGNDGAAITPIFISLDPERDTPERMKSYVAQFSPRVVGLTGTRASLEAAASAYKVYYSKESLPNSQLGYTINHSGFMYLMGPDGTYRAHFAHNASAQSIAEGIRAQLAKE